MALRRTRGYDVCTYDGVAQSYNVAGQYQDTQGAIIPGFGGQPGNAWYIFNSLFGEADYVDVFDEQQTWIIGFHYGLKNEGASPGTVVVEWFQIGNSAGSIISLRNNADQTLSIVTGANNAAGAGVELKRTLVPLAIDAVQYLEFKVTFGNHGSYELRFNGASVLAGPDGSSTMSDSNINLLTTNPGGPTSYPDRITQRWQNFGSDGIVFDNMYVCDGTGAGPCNDFLGPCQVTTYLPSADQFNSGWKPLTPGNLYPMVNQSPGPAGDSAYISPTEVAVTATWQMSPPVPCFGLIYGLTWNINAKPTGGTPFVGAEYQPGSTPQFIGELPITDTGLNLGQNPGPVEGYATYQIVAEVDPLSGDVWQAGNINAAFFGVGSDNFITSERVSQFYIEILTSLNAGVKFGCGGPGSYAYVQ